MRRTMMQLMKMAGMSLALLLLAMTAVAQQDTASLGGRVSDPSGKVLQGAVVSVKSIETGTVAHATTNREGDWLVKSLIPGHYAFSITGAGFKTTEHSAIELQVQDEKFLDHSCPRQHCQ